MYQATGGGVTQVAFFDTVSDELLSYLSRHPQTLHRLGSKEFEIVIARIFRDLGYEVELTRATHDGGKDIILRTETELGPTLAYVECKKWAPDRPVGIDVVQRLYGIQLADHVSKSMVVTTSHFSAPAREFVSRISFLMALRDFDGLISWLKKYGSHI